MQLLEIGPEGSVAAYLVVRRGFGSPSRLHALIPRGIGGGIRRAFHARRASAASSVTSQSALLLSDGIDSQSIRTVLSSRGRSIPAYTFRLLNAESGVALAAPLPGSEPVTDIEASRAERVAQMVPAFGSLTEPVGDGAMLATWMLIRAARASGRQCFFAGMGATRCWAVTA